jgi:hypothetical protein
VQQQQVPHSPSPRPYVVQSSFNYVPRVSPSRYLVKKAAALPYCRHKHARGQCSAKIHCAKNFALGTTDHRCQHVP